MVKAETGYPALLPEFPTILPLFSGLQLTLQEKIAKYEPVFGVTVQLYKDTITYHHQTNGRLEPLIDLHTQTRICLMFCKQNCCVLPLGFGGGVKEELLFHVQCTYIQYYVSSTSGYTTF